MASTYETTKEDVKIVLRAHHIDMEDDEIDELLQNEDERFSKASLAYSDDDEQTVAVLDEIENVLIEDEVLPEKTQKKFRAP